MRRKQVACKWGEAAARAAIWLRALDLSHLDSSSAAMHALGLLLCERRVRFLDIVRGSGPRVSLPCTGELVAASRISLIRTMIAVAKAKEVNMPSYSGEELAEVLGALSLSYARDRDLTVVAMTVRAAGRLKLRHPMLDEASVFLLDQQTEDGAFGLLSGMVAQRESAGAALRAQLRGTVDAISALDAYAGRH